MWFFISDHKQLQRLYLTVLLGEADPLSPDLEHSQFISVSKQSCSKGFMPPPPSPLLLIMLSHIFVFLSQVLFITRFLWSLGWGSLQVPLYRYPYMIMMGKPWRHISLFWCIQPNTFPLLRLYLHLFLSPCQSPWNCWSLLFKSLLTVKQPPHLCWSTWFTVSASCPGRTCNRVCLQFRQIRLLLITSHKWLKV